MTDDLHPISGRRSFLQATAATAGTGVLMTLTKNASLAASNDQESKVTSSDLEILLAAEIAEALAVTTYTNIINRAHAPVDKYQTGR
jgi:hypothetical protein